MLRTVAALCAAGAAAGTTPTPPPPPGTRYHCDGVGNCAANPTQGHGTMAKCVAACPKPPGGVFTQSTFTDAKCSAGEKDNKLPIGTCLGMTGGSGSAIVKSCDSSGVSITQYTSSDCSGSGTAGTQPVDQCLQATAGGYLKNTCSSAGVGSANATLALHATAVTCPSTPAGTACGMEVTATAAASCADVQAEIEDRIAAKNGWYDPHNKGTYTLVKSGAGSVQATRLTGNGKYTDKMTLTLSGSGDTCLIESCSRSQVFSIGDMGTNYCNLKMLFCGKADGCKPVEHDFTSSGEKTKKYAQATVNLKKCLAV